MIWLAHTLAAQLPEDHPGEAGTLYQRLQEIVAKVGGIPMSLLLNPPPPYGDLASPDDMEWLDTLGAEHLPTANNLRDEILAQIPPQVGDRLEPVAKPWQIYLSALLGFEAYQRPTKELLRDVYDSID